MSDYVITCCSTVDLTDEKMQELNIPFICFNFELEGVAKKDDLYQSFSAQELYTAMANGSDTKTSQISVGDYIDFFKSFLKEGKDILHVCLSSGISGTYNSAQLAKVELEEDYPDNHIYIVDSCAASSGYGLLMTAIANQRYAGLNIDDLYHWIRDNKLNVHHWFFSTDLSFFIKGGRISKTAGFIGNALNICPLMNVDNSGRLIPREKIRTKKKVIKAIVEKMKLYAKDRLEYNDLCYISHSNCYEDARAVADLIESNFPNMNGKVQIYDIGATIGSHTGPGTVALFFIGDKREN